MSVCPGCGRCRQCGQPAPVWTVPVYPGTNPWWRYPVTITTPNTTPNYYVGDVLPGMPGYIGVTC